MFDQGPDPVPLVGTTIALIETLSIKYSGAPYAVCTRDPPSRPALDAITFGNLPLLYDCEFNCPGLAQENVNRQL